MFVSSVRRQLMEQNSSSIDGVWRGWIARHANGKAYHDKIELISNRRIETDALEIEWNKWIQSQTSRRMSSRNRDNERERNRSETRRSSTLGDDDVDRRHQIMHDQNTPITHGKINASFVERSDALQDSVDDIAAALSRDVHEVLSLWESIKVKPAL